MFTLLGYSDQKLAVFEHWAVLGNPCQSDKGLSLCFTRWMAAIEVAQL